jgi:branched-chain amino acid transport system permease protein
MLLFWETLVSGLSLGAIFALIALGFSVVYSVLRMFNFAHGDTYMVGVFVMFSLLTAHVNLLLSLLVGMIVAGLLAAAVERFGYRRFRVSHPMMGVIAAIGVALVIRNLVVLKWGVSTQPFPQLLPQSFKVGGVQITYVQVLTFGVLIVLSVALSLFLRYTRWGRAIILVRQDMEVASMMGIPVNRVISVVYAIGGLLGAVGGYLFVATYGVIDPNFGFQMTIDAFIAAVLGGIGGLGGAVVGGIALGLAQQFVGAYISTSYETAVAFGILVIFLLFRPNGILGTEVKGQRV